MGGGFVNATGQGFIKLSSSESGALPAVGADIYRNYDIVFDQELNRSVPSRKIGIELTFTETNDGFFLKAIDEDQVTVTTKIETEKIIANNPERADSSVKEHLTKLGQTEFECVNIYVGTQNSYFIQPKLLNQLRREIVNKLLTERAVRYPKLKNTEPQEPKPYPEKQVYFNGNILNHKAEAFLKKHGVEVMEPAAESGLDMHGRKIFTGKYCLKYQFGLCSPENKDKTYYLVNNQKDRLAVRSNCEGCETEIYLE
jgi:putative protease